MIREAYRAERTVGEKNREAVARETPVSCTCLQPSRFLSQARVKFFMERKIEKTSKLVSSLSGKTLVTFQSLADLDAVASAIAISKIVPRPEIRSTGGMNAQSRAVLGHFGLAIPQLESLKGYSNVVIVDACTADSLGAWGRQIEGFAGRKIIIDHHVHSGRMKADFVLEMPSRSSTCEIVLEILDSAKSKIDNSTALLLASGITSDTAFWKSANDSSFAAMARLLQLAGKGRKDYQKILTIINRPANPEMTRKIIECIGNASLVLKENLSVATSQSNAFHLQCAAGLVRLGCDYAFVADRDRGIVLAARSDRVDGSAGKIMEKVGKKIRGSGGGHEKVGGARGSFADAKEVLDYCSKLALREK